LVDSGNDYAEILGIKFALVPAVKEIYSKFGIDLPAANGDDSWTLPVPTRLVVAADGIVHYSAIDVDYTHRPEPAETVAAIPV
jgi:peroxiredoxin